MLQSKFILHFIAMQAPCIVAVIATNVQLTVSQLTTGNKFMRFYVMLAVFWDDTLQ